MIGRRELIRYIAPQGGVAIGGLGMVITFATVDLPFCNQSLARTLNGIRLSYILFRKPAFEREGLDLFP